MATITSTTIGSSDQEKFLAAKLLQRTNLRLVCASICEKIAQPKGSGLTANFVRYTRMQVPLTALTEGTDPSDSTFSLETVTATMDQWGAVLTLSDVAILTTAHPLLQQAMDLLSDNAQRVIDREVQIVWLAGTNVQYGDGSVTARASITTAMKLSDATIHKARITLSDAGVPGRGGPYKEPKGQEAAGTLLNGQHYLGVAGPQVMADIMASGTSLGTFASVATYANQKSLYNSEIGTWLGVRWVETNFIPKFTMLGNTTAAVASAAAGGTNTPVITAVATGGDLKSATTYFWKVTRKSLTRGFEEDISIAHSTSSGGSGDNESFTFNFTGLTAGYVYNLYFDSVVDGGTGTDATLLLHTANIAVGTTVTVTTEQLTGTAAPANVNTTGSPNIYVVYIHGESSVGWVGLQELQVMVTPDAATTDNPLKLRRKVSYKFMGKSYIRNQSCLIRVEVASTY